MGRNNGPIESGARASCACYLTLAILLNARLLFVTIGGGNAMRIKGSEFGNITIGRKTYDHDVIIRLSGKGEETSEEALEKTVRNIARHFEGGG